MNQLDDEKNEIVVVPVWASIVNRIYRIFLKILMWIFIASLIVRTYDLVMMLRMR